MAVQNQFPFIRRKLKEENSSAVVANLQTFSSTDYKWATSVTITRMAGQEDAFRTPNNEPSSSIYLIFYKQTTRPGHALLALGTV